MTPAVNITTKIRGVYVTRLLDQIEEPARTDLLAARSDDSSGQQRVSTLQTWSRRVEWWVFSSKTAATRPTQPPLQMKASSFQIRQRLAIFHLDWQRFCSNHLRSNDFGSDLAIFFKKSLRSMTFKLRSVTCKLRSVTLAYIRWCLSSDQRRFTLLLWETAPPAHFMMLGQTHVNGWSCVVASQNGGSTSYIFPFRLRVLQWSRHLFNYWKNKKIIIEKEFLILLIWNWIYIDYRKITWLWS